MMKKKWKPEGEDIEEQGVVLSFSSTSSYEHQVVSQKPAHVWVIARPNAFLRLPVEMWELIFSFMDLSTLFCAQQISRNFYQLVWSTQRRLRFSNLTSDAVLQQTIARCRKTQIQEIDLFGCSTITDNGLSSIAPCKNLKYLNLKRCRSISDEGIKILSENHVNLIELHLKLCPLITDISLSRTISQLLKLKKLNLSYGYFITDKGIKNLGVLKNLEYLNVSACKKITDQSLQVIGGLTSLTNLNLGWCRNITNSGIKHLSSLTNLTKLNLSLCKQLTDDAFSPSNGFISLKNLQHLNIDHCPLITDTVIDHLSYLSSNTMVPNDDADRDNNTSTGFTKIHTLVLSFCEQITDVGISKLEFLGFPCLTSLDVSNCVKVTDVSIPSFQNITNLEFLNVQRTGITNVDDVENLLYLQCGILSPTILSSLLPFDDRSNATLIDVPTFSPEQPPAPSQLTSNPQLTSPVTPVSYTTELAQSPSLTTPSSTPTPTLIPTQIPAPTPTLSPNNNLTIPIMSSMIHTFVRDEQLGSLSSPSVSSVSSSSPSSSPSVSVLTTNHAFPNNEVIERIKTRTTSIVQNHRRRSIFSSTSSTSTNSSSLTMSSDWSWKFPMARPNNNDEEEKKDKECNVQ
eukprot:TRINITY_DN9694_c0_g1_i1.p1 TRINITY_DN9694_c0_g1~~TRINITY_DN9694_c0_g1_i1.p1  ORF type:complete len:628 (+),score=101.61 TRINITY_DN9694_c0_g1_i1:70-1953(+)